MPNRTGDNAKTDIEGKDRPSGPNSFPQEPVLKIRDQCINKLESLGFRIGQSLVERFTKDTARFKDDLDIMKFICKDFWSVVFKKQIDNLRTNHQGVYVLQDNKFRFLTQMSNGKQYMEISPRVNSRYSFRGLDENTKDVKFGDIHIWKLE
ncbi:trafficking protein particle complex subunit 6B-like [Mya arenaria]|uniref:trafficking protein particle complex subunit 6B-like n=1 Tax=Mya arenaria TaxID=6604 RepID=UPI0022E1AC89|nr:trafficking protein particle complex subunit 6B-like [Mya arenaria]